MTIKSNVSTKLLSEVVEIEKHIHNSEKWFGLAGTPAGETHNADRVGGATSPFTLTAGNNDFGSWVQILGSSDTPVVTGMTKFDPHRFLVTTTNSTNAFIIQVVIGESADIAAKLAAEEFTEFMYIAATNNSDSGIEDVIKNRCAAGVKLWARCACIGSSGSTLNMYYGIHEYER